MKKLLHGILYLLVANFCISQTPHTFPINFTHADSPRIKDDADKPGNYEVASKFNEIEIDPGGVIELQIYFTGYGKIGKSKLMFFTSGDIFDSTQSVITSSLKLDTAQLGHGNSYISLAWGDTTQSAFDEPVSTYSLLGVEFPEWKKETLFFDANPSKKMDLSLMTEHYLKGAPILLHLKSLPRLPGGTYEINLYFTYFNGLEWKGSKQIVRFKVKTVEERNENWITFITIFASIIGIGAAYSGYKDLGKDVVGFFRKKRARKINKIKL